MKTNNKFGHFVRILALCILYLIGKFTVQAQDRDKYAKDRGGNRHDKYRNDDPRQYSRNDEQRNYNGPGYIRRAPWGIHRPLILFHNRNRVYYYRGRYYEYYPNRGYLMMEIPSGYIFDEVPSGFRRVWIDGRWCYRLGNLYLRPSIHGFIAFPGPFGMRIGANF